MKATARLSILGGSLALLLCLIVLWQMFFEPSFSDVRSLARASLDRSWGERLDFARLHSAESILVESTFIACQGESYATRYVVGGDDRFMTVFDCHVRWERIPWSLATTPVVVEPELKRAVSVDDSEMQGLRAFLDVLRLRPGISSTAAVRFRVEYRRDQKVIGEEEFVTSPDFQFRKSDLHHFSLREMSESYGIPHEVLMRVVSPEMLNEEAANQALQTTPMTRSVYEKTIEFGRPQRGV
jgi:hypothetical protein